MSFTSHLRPVSQILTFGKIPGSSLGRTPTRRWCIWGPAWHSHGFGRLFISNPYTSLKGRVFMWGFRFRHVFFGPNCLLFTVILGGGLKYFSFSPLVGEDFQFDEHIFQMGWFNHQPELLFKTKPQTKKKHIGAADRINHCFFGEAEPEEQPDSHLAVEIFGKRDQAQENYPYPYQPCMVYLPTFTKRINQM